MRRIVVVLVLGFTACGSGDDGGATTRSFTTTSINPPALTSTPAGTTPVTTTTIATTTTTGQPVAARAYFMLDDLEGQGPFLASVHRIVDGGNPLEGVLLALLDGLNSEEKQWQPSFSTAVPSGTRLLGASVQDGVVEINLSREFESGGGTLSMSARLAQLVYTATQFPKSQKVKMLLDGQPVEVFSSEGLLLDQPMDRDDALELLPPIFIDDPGFGGPLESGQLVVGKSNVFEATSQIALFDASGAKLYEHFVTATCGTGCWGDWFENVTYNLASAQTGILRVWEFSAKDGSPIHVQEYPVRLG